MLIIGLFGGVPLDQFLVDNVTAILNALNLSLNLLTSTRSLYLYNIATNSTYYYQNDLNDEVLRYFAANNLVLSNYQDVLKFQKHLDAEFDSRYQISPVKGYCTQ